MLHYFVPLPPKQFDDTVSANKVQGTDHDEIIMIIIEEANDGRQPPSIAVGRELAVKIGKLLETLTQQLLEVVRVTTAPS
jgi:hypothetical protein